MGDAARWVCAGGLESSHPARSCGVAQWSAHSPASARPRQRGGAWVSVSCKPGGNREIMEFPGTVPGALRSARRRGQGWTGVRCRRSVARWKFQREPEETVPGKAPPECTCPSPLSLVVLAQKVEVVQEGPVDGWQVPGLGREFYTLKVAVCARPPGRRDCEHQVGSEEWGCPPEIAEVPSSHSECPYMKSSSH